MTPRTAPTSPSAVSSRPPLRCARNLKIVAGRIFSPGLRELIVGAGVLRQFQGAEIGKVVRMRGSDWTVVGVVRVRRCPRQRAVDRHQRGAHDLRAHRLEFDPRGAGWRRRPGAAQGRRGRRSTPERRRDPRAGLLQRPDQAVSRHHRLPRRHRDRHHGPRRGVRRPQQHVRGRRGTRQGDRHPAGDRLWRHAGAGLGDDRSTAAGAQRRHPRRA